MMMFDLSIYSTHAIHQAAADYAGLADISIHSVDGFCICSFSNCQYDLQTTQDEFANYVLDLTVQENSPHDLA